MNELSNLISLVKPEGQAQGNILQRMLMNGTVRTALFSDITDVSINEHSSEPINAAPHYFKSSSTETTLYAINKSP